MWSIIPEGQSLRPFNECDNLLQRNYLSTPANKTTSLTFLAAAVIHQTNVNADSLINITHS